MDFFYSVGQIFNGFNFIEIIFSENITVIKIIGIRNCRFLAFIGIFL